MSNVLPPKDELLAEFDNGKVPRSETWHTLITGLYFNFDSVSNIENWYQTVQELTSFNQDLATTIQQNYDQIEIWYGQIDSWQQQVELDQQQVAADKVEVLGAAEECETLTQQTKQSEASAASYSSSAEGFAKTASEKASLSEQLTQQNESLANVVRQDHDQVELWHSDVNRWQQQVSQSEVNVEKLADSALESKNSAESSAGTATEQAVIATTAANKLTAISNPNLLINADFTVNQRGIFGGTVGPGVTYFCDRWRLWIDYNQQLNFNSFQQGQSTSETYYVNLRPVGKVNLTVVQTIEPSYFFSFFDNSKNKKMTASIEVHSAISSGNIDIQVYFEYTDGKPLAIKSQSVNIPQNVWANKSVTFDFLDVDYQNVKVVVYHIVLSNIAIDGNTILLRRPKLEFGPIATPFIPDDPATNLAKCQRYCQKYVNPRLIGVINSATLAQRCGMNLVSSMRTTPTINWNFTSCHIYDGANIGAITAIEAAYATPNSVEFDLIYSTQMNIGNPAILYAQSDFTGFIILTSEL